MEVGASRQTRFTIAEKAVLIVTLLNSMSYLTPILWEYFCMESYYRYGYEFALQAWLFPDNTWRGFVFTLILLTLSIYMWVRPSGCWRFLSTDADTRTRNSAHTALIGCFGSYIFLNAYQNLKTEFAALVQKSEIDMFLRAEFEGTASLPLPEGFVRELVLPTQVFVGMFEEIAYAWVILLVLKVLGHRRSSIRWALGFTLILRGLYHLHMGSVWAVVWFAPMAVFATLYVHRTGRVIPLVIGHGIFNLVFGAQQSLFGGAIALGNIAHSYVQPLMGFVSLLVLAIAVVTNLPSKSARVLHRRD